MPFQKGHPGYKKVGTKNGTTLLAEERRAIFDAKISDKWDEIIDKLPPTYVADQFLGKSPDILKATVEVKKALSEKVAKIIHDYTHGGGETTNSR